MMSLTKISGHSLTVDPQADGGTLPGAGHVLRPALVAASVRLGHRGQDQAVTLQSKDNINVRILLW